MAGTSWIMFWIGYGLIGLLIAFLFDHYYRRQSGLWLALWLAMGGLALLAMVPSLWVARPHVLTLPAPWPNWVVAPIPLAPVWAFVGSILFLSSVLVGWPQAKRRYIFYALLPLLSGIGIYLWSGDGLMLLLAWEFISATTYLGLATSRRARPVWHAGWALLALSELGGMLLLIALALLMPPVTGERFHDSFSVLTHQATHLLPWQITLIMVLALLAFGVKAGLFPLMIWMPLAEPEAPGVVAGIFSGLLTALAVSGVLAIDQIVHPGLAFGIITFVLGVLGALTGALYGLVARHVKRILAYSTLEILGVVFAAIGIWNIESIVSPHNVASNLVLDGAILLLIMHAGAKFTLFSSTDFTAPWGTALDNLGGIIHRAPWTTAWVLVAVITLSGIPPLGGFEGEWLTLEAMLKPLGPSMAATTAHLGIMIGGALLALALGVTTYFRWFAFTFLGVMHKKHPKTGFESPSGFRWGLAMPSLILALISGPGLPWLLPIMDHSLGSLLANQAFVIAPTFVRPQTAAPLVQIGANLIKAPGAAGTVFFPQGFAVQDPYVLFILGSLLIAGLAFIRSRMKRRHPIRKVPPWTGGAVPFNFHLSYTGEGFVHPLRLAFARFYGLRRNRYNKAGARFFRQTIVYRLETHLYQPILDGMRMVGATLRRIQSGRVTQYVAYVWVTLLILVTIAVAQK